MHNLSVKTKGKKAQIKLDGFEIQGVLSYELKKSSAENLTELTVTIQIKTLNLGLEEGSDNF